MTADTTTHISADMKAAVGRKIRRSTSFPVAASDIRRWAIAVYYPDPPPERFWNEEAAKSGPFGGIVAPEDFNPFAWMAAEATDDGNPIDPDNTERLIGVGGPGLKFQLNGGLDVTYGAAIRPGDVIRSVRTLAGYTEREGRLGLMLFTTLEDLWTNSEGDEVRRSRMTIIRY